MKDIINLVDFLWFKLKRNFNLKDEQSLKYQIRRHIHFLEKSKPEDSRYLYKFLKARNLYNKGRNKNILSKNEIKWCERVLYGKSTSSKEEKNKYSSEERKKIDKFIKNRRSIRQSWKKEPLTRKDFESLIEIARWAPSACNRQPWNFILTIEKKKIELLADQRGKWIEDAPSCILVSMDLAAYKEVESTYTPYLDAGSIIQTLLLKAEAMGYGTCWVNFGKKEVDDKDRKKIRDEFSLPERLKIISIIPIGRYDKKPKAPSRKDTSSMIYLERYD